MKFDPEVVLSHKEEVRGIIDIHPDVGEVIPNDCLVSGNGHVEGLPKTVLITGVAFVREGDVLHVRPKWPTYCHK